MTTANSFPLRVVTFVFQAHNALRLRLIRGDLKLMGDTYAKCVTFVLFLMRCVHDDIELFYRARICSNRHDAKLSRYHDCPE